MGIAGISIWQLLIVLAIVVLLFGTSRLRTIGGDLGSAIRGFRDSMQDTTAAEDKAQDSGDQDTVVVGVEARGKESPST